MSFLQVTRAVLPRTVGIGDYRMHFIMVGRIDVGHGNCMGH